MVKKNLEERVARLEDLHQIQNLMGKMMYLLSAGMNEEIVELYAHKTPGVSAEISDWGYFEGIEGVKKIYLGIHHEIERDRIGFILEHDLTTPIIEVAGDGKTAKGIWAVPGFQTAREEKCGKMRAFWDWVKYAVDFVKEDGNWRFWHFKVYLTFYTPFNEGWVESAEKAAKLPPKDPSIPVWKNYPPDKPTTYHNPYSLSGVRELAPAIPEPYETYTDPLIK